MTKPNNPNTPSEVGEENYLGDANEMVRNIDNNGTWKGEKYSKWAIEKAQHLLGWYRQRTRGFDLPYEYIESVAVAFDQIAYQAERRGEERGVKYTIAQFLQMNLENPKAPVNVDEVKRRAINSLRTR